MVLGVYLASTWMPRYQSHWYGRSSAHHSCPEHEESHLLWTENLKCQGIAIGRKCFRGFFFPLYSLNVYGCFACMCLCTTFVLRSTFVRHLRNSWITYGWTYIYGCWPPYGMEERPVLLTSPLLLPFKTGFYYIVLGSPVPGQLCLSIHRTGKLNYTHLV